MKTEPNSPIPEEVEGEIIEARRSGIAWSWLFPLLALAATGWLFWSNWKSKGPEIMIHFSSAPGIEPGKTPLIFRGVKAGTVSKVRLDEGLGTVTVSVQLQTFAKELATEDTEFWIAKPIITLHEVAGLESIIQGNSIHARPRGGTAPATVFTALDEAPLEPLAENDLVIRLNSNSISFLERGTPVFHHGVTVGKVRRKGFDDQGRSQLEVTIFEQFADKVRSNSRFWVASATAVSASPGALRLDIPSLQGLLDGSIVFDQFGPDGDAAPTESEFELSPNAIAARAEGPRLSISFEDGQGLRAGETRVTSRGQPVGLVEQITPDPTGGRVVVEVRLDAAFAPLATADSTFTILRPSVSRKGLQGLDTLVTGRTIVFEPGSAKEVGTSFAGHVLPQLDWESEVPSKGGTRLVLRAASIPQFEPGAPIYHKGMIAGRVIEQRLEPNGQPELIATIDPEFKSALRANSRFWHVPVANLSLGPDLIDVELRGISKFLQGGIAFDSFGPSEEPASELAAFELFPNEHTASATSEPVQISFDDGQGLVAGKTELHYLGIPVGIVERVETRVGSVEAFARFKPGYDFLSTEGAEFAIVRPEITLKGVHGLDTIIQGVYIACAPSSDNHHAESFVAVPQDEAALENENGLEIIIESPSTRVDAGAPIDYNQTPVGEVTKKTLSQDGKRIFLTVKIREPHRDLVRTNSVFWDATTVEAKIGFFKVEIGTPSVVDPAGRIAFHTPDHGGVPARKMSKFFLLAEPPKFEAEAAQDSPKKNPAGALRNWKR